MPRPSKGARLWYDASAGTWCIRDGRIKRNLGLPRGDQGAAEEALAAYLAEKYRPPVERRADALTVADVLVHYLRTRAGNHAAPDVTGHYAARILDWWGPKRLAEINTATCAEYVEHRRAATNRRATRSKAPKPIAIDTIRRELSVLSAAVHAWHADHPLPAVPTVTLPPKPPPRARWLTRAEVARMLRAARRHPDRDAGRAIARFVILAVYTGSRSEAVRALSWHPTPVGGWVDLAAGILHRRGASEGETNKRRPPARIPIRILGTLRRWHASDHRRPADAPDDWRPPTRVIHYRGGPVEAQRRAWSWIVAEAGLGPDVVGHTLRHTAITWAMLDGIDRWDAAHFFGVSADVLESVYGHHHPDYQGEIAARIGRGGRREKS